MPRGWFLARSIAAIPDGMDGAMMPTGSGMARAIQHRMRLVVAPMAG